MFQGRKPLHKRIILFLFFKYCRNEEWELYKNKIGVLLDSVQKAHIRDIVTRISADGLRKAIEEHTGDTISLVDIIVDAYTDQNYYERRTKN